MRIFDAKTIRDIDKLTIDKQQITSDELMERAGTQIFNWMHLRLQGANVKLHVFCGIGNNGGDGLVVGRHLMDHGYQVAIYVVNYSEKRSEDFLTNFDRVKSRKYWPELINSEDDFPQIGSQDIVVDAIFGIGLNRPPVSWVGKLIDVINASQAFILSVDIPSGMYMDRSISDEESIIRSNITLTFESPKLPFFLPRTGPYVQGWEVIPIGWDPELLTVSNSGMELIGKPEALSMYIPRERFSHKGTYGHSLIIGGSKGKMGAVILASRACLLSGSGLVTAYIPERGEVALQTAVPEVMVATDTEDDYIKTINLDISPNAIGIGPGMGTLESTVEALENFLKEVKLPLVVDADALNILSTKKELLKLLPENSVLTPHPGELERLTGGWKNDFDKLKKAKALSKRHKCIINLKDSYSIVVQGDQLYINGTGNPGMATAGSGDALTGIITGLLAQGYEPLKAVIFGNYLHGKAGDLAIEKTGYQSLTAGILIDHIGAAYMDLFKREEVPQAEGEETASDNKPE